MTTTPTSSFRIQNSEFRIPRAFTLIEILVVVAIIIVLMAILLPALSSAKAAARKAETRSLLSSLSTDCEAYFTTFNAYPGPAAPSQTTTAGSTKLTGTQNLLLGLSYSANAAAAAPAVQVIPAYTPAAPAPAITGMADPTKPTGPTDFGSLSPSNTYRSMAAFYSPAAKELSPAIVPSAAIPVWNPAGVATSPAATAVAFPTILDRYPDALPILYYRKAPGVDGTATFDNTGNINGTQGAGTSASTAAIIKTGVPGSANVSAYYYDENHEYTTGVSITSLSGVSYPQSVTPDALATEIAANNNNNATSHGGYVLISAGQDRLYGGGNKSDDLVLVGGQ